MYGAGDVRVIDVPDPAIQQQTDALVRVVRACVCGSDLHPYHTMPETPEGVSMGHEFVGVVEEVGREVSTLAKGDFVIAPFAFSDGTLVKAPAGEDSALLPSLLALSDVLGTGYHAAVKGGVNERTTVTVIGDGAVGLLAVLSARRLGAQQIILMGRHKTRTDHGREFGATDVVAERGEEGIAKVRDLTDGHGSHVVLEAVGHFPAYERAYGIVRPGGVISRVGVPQYEEAPIGFGSLFAGNITLTGGPAPARAYMEELLPAVLDGTIEPGKVFDHTVDLDRVPDGYRAMDNRVALKVLVQP